MTQYVINRSLSAPSRTRPSEYASARRIVSEPSRLLVVPPRRRTTSKKATVRVSTLTAHHAALLEARVNEIEQKLFGVSLPQRVVQQQHDEAARTSSRWSRDAKRWWYGMAVAVSAGVLALTGYVSIDTWVTNTQVRDVVRQEASTLGASDEIVGEGDDESDVTTDAVDAYTVAPELPRVLSIPDINVRARVLPMSVNTDGSIQAPINIFDSGWYAGSAKPGEAGASFIDAHASGMTRQGLFAYLDTLTRGADISIERGDGTKLTYQVAAVETYSKDEIDMKQLLRPYNGASEGLNLMTCTGKWLPDEKTYDQRVVVFAVRV